MSLKERRDKIIRKQQAEAEADVVVVEKLKADAFQKELQKKLDIFQREIARRIENNPLHRQIQAILHSPDTAQAMRELWDIWEPGNYVGKQATKEVRGLFGTKKVPDKTAGLVREKVRIPFPGMEILEQDGFAKFFSDKMSYRNDQESLEGRTRAALLNEGNIDLETIYQEWINKYLSHNQWGIRVRGETSMKKYDFSLIFRVKDQKIMFCLGRHDFLEFSSLDEILDLLAKDPFDFVDDVRPFMGNSDYGW